MSEPTGMSPESDEAEGRLGELLQGLVGVPSGEVAATFLDELPDLYDIHVICALRAAELEAQQAGHPGPSPTTAIRLSSI